MWWLLGVLGLTLGGWGIFSARRALYPERRTSPPPEPAPAYTTQILRSSDGGTFDVWRLEAASPRGRLLIFHGYYANRHQVLGLAAGLRERGYESCLIELRGHGERAGPCTFGLKETDDALTVLQWLQERTRSNPLPLGVLGFSMGAMAACRLAYRDPQVRAVVTDSPYPFLYPIIRFNIKRHYHLSGFPWAWVTWVVVRLILRQPSGVFDPAAIAPRLQQPLLTIQGGQDTIVPPEEGETFYRRWGGPKERWCEPDAAHVEVYKRDPRAYCNRVASFFDRTLA